MQELEKDTTASLLIVLALDDPVLRFVPSNTTVCSGLGLHLALALAITMWICEHFSWIPVDIDNKIIWIYIAQMT